MMLIKRNLMKEKRDEEELDVSVDCEESLVVSVNNEG